MDPKKGHQRNHSGTNSTDDEGNFGNFIKGLTSRPSKKSFGIPPIISAAKRGDYDELVAQLNSGNSVLTKDDGGNSVIFHAAENGHVSCVSLCIERKADVSSPNNDGWTPLHAAACGETLEHEACIGLLLNNGANIKSRNNSNETALQLAERRSPSKTIIKLLKREWISSSILELRGLVGSQSIDPGLSESLKTVVDYASSLQAELDDTNRRIQVLELQISNATILAAKSISLSEVTQQNELENGDSPPVSPIQNVSKFYEKEPSKSGSTCYECMQSQVQMTKLKREYDELLAKNKKLSSSTAKAARDYESKISTLEGEIEKTKKEKEEAIEKSEQLIKRADATYTNKISKITLETEVVLKKIQEELAEVETDRKELLKFQETNKSLTWVPDALVTHCFGPCLRKFTSSLRKHHCRCCGRVFCGDCSPIFQPLPVLGFLKPVRICLQCNHSLTSPKSPFAPPRNS